MNWYVRRRKPRFLNRGKKRRSVSTLSTPQASDREVEWVDYTEYGIEFQTEKDRQKGP